MQKLILLALTILSPFVHAQVRIGASWIEQDPGVNTSFNCVSASNRYYNRSVWICGDNSVVLKSYYESEKWEKASSNLPSGIKLNTICISDSAVLTAGNIGSNAMVYRSIDSGKSWNVIFSQSGGRINSIDYTFDSTAKLFMAGNPVEGRWSLWRSFDHGLTWDSAGLYVPQIGNESGIINSLFFSIDNISFGTDDYRIYFSSNMGFNWQIYPFPEKNIYSILMGGYDCYAAGNNLFYCVNGNSNWINKSSEGSGLIKSLFYYRDFMPGIYTCGPYYFWYIRGNKIYFSCDNVSWRAEHTPSSGNFTSLTNGTFNLYAVTDAGRISKSIALYDSSTVTANSFISMQNYPNPFNTSTNIKIRLYKSAHIKINIYNSAGEQVAKLLDNTFIVYSVWPYYYYLEANWDGTNFPSGVYFYRVSTDDHQETGKMILVK